MCNIEKVYEKRLLKRLRAPLNPMSLNRDSNQNGDMPIHMKMKTKFISNSASGKCIRIAVDKDVPVGWHLGNINQTGDKNAGKRRWYHDPLSGIAFHLAPENAMDSLVEGRGPKYESNSKTLKGKMRWITNGINSLFVSSLEIIPVGWKFGRTRSTKEQMRQRRANELRGPMRWITDGSKNKMVPTGTNLPAGWNHGMTKA